MNCRYFHGFWSSPNKLLFCKGKRHASPPGWASGNNCSLLFLETGKPCTAVTKCQMCWKLQFWYPRAAVCLLRPNNLIEFNKSDELLRKFNSSLSRCSKFDGKVHWLHGRNTDRVNWGTMSHTGTWEHNIKEELPTGSRGPGWTLHFQNSLCKGQGHKATAERAWDTGGFSQILGQEWFTNFC